MALYITSAATLTLGKVFGIRIEINKALTGTLTIADGGSTVGVIAIGGTGTREMWGFTGSVTLVNSAGEDITVSIINDLR
jgi:hypothetical protein